MSVNKPKTRGQYKPHRRPGRYVHQPIRDEQAAAVNRTWLEDCDESNRAKKIQCNNCGDITKATPNNVARGSRCFKCAMAEESQKKRQQAQPMWQKLAGKINAELLGEVESVDSPVALRCLDCNCEWEIRANTLKYKSRSKREKPWCPDCADEYMAQRAFPDIKHGGRGYAKGCRCKVCSDAKRQENTLYLYRRKHRQQ